MADSNLTKRALAGALKELMGEKGISGVSVTEICGRCDMNRKSFYYHFRDKYDLVNWIFDTEFAAPARERDGGDMLPALCGYLYGNRDFYRKAMQNEGQNSFYEHFRELLRESVRPELERENRSGNIGDFQVNFFSDAAAIAFRRWITDKNPMEPEEFLAELRMCVMFTSQRTEN